jgi:hypothetical protein
MCRLSGSVVYSAAALVIGNGFMTGMQSYDMRGTRSSCSKTTLVHTTTIRDCWRKSGILPTTLLNPDSAPNAPTIRISSLLNNEPANSVTAAENHVSASLDHLEEIGVLQRGNWMDLTELLNPVSEGNVYKEVTEEEIYQAVVERCEAEQQKDINGGDDSDDDSESAEKPSRHEALSAALTIQKYIAELDEPFAHKLEGLLASFGHQTCLDELRSLRPTTITDYFT